MFNMLIGREYLEMEVDQSCIYHAFFKGDDRYRKVCATLQ